jgi:hypothetical protein
MIISVSRRRLDLQCRLDECCGRGAAIATPLPVWKDALPNTLRKVLAQKLQAKARTQEVPAPVSGQRQSHPVCGDPVWPRHCLDHADHGHRRQYSLGSGLALRHLYSPSEHNADRRPLVPVPPSRQKPQMHLRLQEPTDVRSYDASFSCSHSTWCRKISDSGYPISVAPLYSLRTSTTYAWLRNEIIQAPGSLYFLAVLAICGKRSKIVKGLISCDGEVEHLIAIDD